MGGVIRAKDGTTWKEVIDVKVKNIEWEKPSDVHIKENGVWVQIIPNYSNEITATLIGYNSKQGDIKIVKMAKLNNGNIFIVSADRVSESNGQDVYDFYHKVIKEDGTIILDWTLFDASTTDYTSTQTGFDLLVMENGQVLLQSHRNLVIFNSDGLDINNKMYYHDTNFNAYDYQLHFLSDGTILASCYASLTTYFVGHVFLTKLNSTATSIISSVSIDRQSSGYSFIYGSNVGVSSNKILIMTLLGENNTDVTTFDTKEYIYLDYNFNVTDFFDSSFTTLSKNDTAVGLDDGSFITYIEDAGFTQGSYLLENGNVIDRPLTRSIPPVTNSSLALDSGKSLTIYNDGSAVVLDISATELNEPFPLRQVTKNIHFHKISNTLVYYSNGEDIYKLEISNA